MTKKYLTMNILKKIVILLLMFTSLESYSQTLVLHHVDGSTTEIELYTMPQVLLEDDNILVKSPVVNMQFPKDEISSFTYKNLSTEIKDVTSNDDVSSEEGILVFHNVDLSKEIAVYRLNGTKVHAQISIKGNDVAILLSSLQSGIYILSINGKNQKIIKK